MQIISAFLKTHGLDKIAKEHRLAKTVHVVADIPWGEARTIEEVIKWNKGTCTGKHELLQACLTELGIYSKPVVCTFKWVQQGIEFPSNLQRILAEGEWNHGHNFLQITGHGQPIDIDVTWNPSLKQHGFKTLPADWNGEYSFIGVEIVDRFDNVDMPTMKQNLIDSLPPELRERRERFLHEFIVWMDTIRSA